MTQSPPYTRSPELLARTTSRLLIVDVQEKLLPAIPVRRTLLHNCRRLLEAAVLLDVPAAATEQYPRGLGSTAAELADLLTDRPEKTRFSCCETLGMTFSGDDERHQIVVAGIEAHVCVLQTSFDLLSAGYRVYVPADAVASRSKLDWRIALRRMADAGATIVTSESVLFEWCETSATAEFKQISDLIKRTP